MIPTNKAVARLSIIIPTFNEAHNMPSLLRSLPQRSDIEIVVVDGGSSDATLSHVRAANIEHFVCAASRGAQLDMGIQNTSGNVLWFLHADSNVNAAHVDAILEHLDLHPNVIGGNFTIEFDGDDPFSAWLNRFYAAIRRRGFYYGDSGIFIRRKTLLTLGGIPPRALMEDYALVRNMETYHEPTVCLSSPKIVSSSRRFRGRKKWNIIAGWIMIHLMFYLRLPDAWLVKAYDSLRTRQHNA